METNDFSSRWTPVNDSNPRCLQTHATLCIYNIDHDLITEKLGIEPTRGQTKGTPHNFPRGNTIISRVSSWGLSSREHVSSKDLRTHLDWLMDKIEPVIPQLKELQRIPEIKMSVRCSWWSEDNDSAAIVLWPEQMERLAKANLEISLEITCWGETEEELNQIPDDT